MSQYNLNGTKSIIHELIVEVNAIPNIDDDELMEMKMRTKSLLLKSLEDINSDIESVFVSDRNFKKYRRLEMELYNMVKSLQKIYKTVK